MTFDLGKEKNQIVSDLKNNPTLLRQSCRKSYGISTNSNFPIFFKVERLYIFNPAAWTKNDYNKILKQIDLDQGIEEQNER